MTPTPSPVRPTPARPKVQGLSRERAQRLRIAWFVLGTLFGIFLSFFLQDRFGSNSYEEDGVEATDEDTSGQHSDAEPSGAPTGSPLMAEQAWPRTVDVTISSGDTLQDLLVEQGLTYEAASAVMKTVKSAFDPRELKVGHVVSMILDHDPEREEKDAAQLAEMNIILSNLEQVRVRQEADGSYDAERTKKKVVLRTALGGSRITSSFYMAAKRSGVPDRVILELIKNYSYDVDFQRDIKVGDRIEVLYESMETEDGERVGTGKVLYAMLHTGGEDKKLYRYEDKGGDGRFYNEKGESIIKKLLRTPIDGARISSGFGMRRHPVMGFSRMHKGIDFAAPMGTPIYAAGDGIVEFAGRSNGYGNFIKMRHNSTWESGYGHISRFASGMHKGKSVRQGDVIAYVGMTGMATGPHLHYELIKFGSQINPAGVQMAGGNKLEGRELLAFRTAQKKITSDIARLETEKAKDVAEAKP